MPSVEGEIIINRPVDVVFDYVADQSNEPQYNPQMVRAEKITPGPVTKGTQFRSAVASMGRTAEMLITCTRYERPALLASTTAMQQADISYTLTFEPTELCQRSWTVSRVVDHAAVAAAWNSVRASRACGSRGLSAAVACCRTPRCSRRRRTGLGPCRGRAAGSTSRSSERRRSSRRRRYPSTRRCGRRWCGCRWPGRTGRTRPNVY